MNIEKERIRLLKRLFYLNDEVLERIVSGIDLLKRDYNTLNDKTILKEDKETLLGNTRYNIHVISDNMIKHAIDDMKKYLDEYERFIQAFDEKELDEERI